MRFSSLPGSLLSSFLADDDRVANDAVPLADVPDTILHAEPDDLAR
jgi:hypothetical protein